MNRIRLFHARRLPAFTLVELLVAMTITLVLMAALGRSFAFIGRNMKEGRSKVSLSSKLRGISFRLRSDLSARTVDAKPPISSQSGKGYFVYYEGPLTESTFGTYADEPVRIGTDGTVYRASDTTDTDTDGTTDYYDQDIEKGPTYKRHSRIGDFDDYVAFTAEAPGDDWFTGKVPAYLVDDSAADPMEPRIIRSKYAEIIMWASPQWDVDAATNTLQYEAHPSAMPKYQDQDMDGVPDRIKLHQRVLLIRPDLNVRRTLPYAAPLVRVEANVLRPLNNSTNPDAVPTALQRLYPIGINNGAAATPPTPMFSNYVDGTTATDNTQFFNSNWLVGMTPLHHFFDLSLRRVVHPVTGEPTPYVAANSLEDLVQPHNRFAHVRYPGRHFGRGTTGSDYATSMPLLALGTNNTVLNAASPWVPNGHHPNLTTVNALGAPATRSGLFNGWLLPQFELGDANPPATAGTTDHWQRGYLVANDPRWDRSGEDVIAANLLAFDIKGFDQTAPIFLTSGLDGAPGREGVNDDGVPTSGADAIDQTAIYGGQYVSELGAVGSDDELVHMGDEGIYNIIRDGVFSPDVAGTGGFHQHMLASRGDFVDLYYPYLAGGPLRDLMQYTASTKTPAITAPATPQPRVAFNYTNFLVSQFSGYPIPVATLNDIKRSGKLVHSSGTGDIAFFQPTYDTWTDGYETDGFDQTHRTSGAVTGGQMVGTTWVLNDAVSTVAGRNARLPTPAATPLPFSVDTGNVIPTDPETSAPINAPLPAISITIRMGDPASNQMTQFTVIESLD
ncbi:hypothetical protein CA13_34670 [Planctomycetes bacterium CA13]|uniref:Uncharacterized protein n=1 Tax=Novipirellula herctigrandis TaxID=2527986 RepID=A0A5C5Z3R3_9BACT|nr:hypothetical protein CA13_34670 [Planctomycetes bacterium CA13]